MIEQKMTLPEIVAVLTTVLKADKPVAFDADKQKFFFLNEQDDYCELTLPAVLPKLKMDLLTASLAKINGFSHCYTIALIQSGAASIGYFENGQCVYHRVIKKYMVRKKQGKSQIKFLKSKGKSRLGSRIRLQNTVRFFEEINETFTQWGVGDKSEIILLALPINLKNLLFTSGVPTPFDKKDPRIKKVPFDTKVPSYKELGRINWLVTRGTLVRGKPFVK